MAKMKIENFGPVSSGLLEDDGFLDFSGVTVFIGNQGTGKSTVAKVFSTFSWIEKALVRGDFSPESISEHNRFREQLNYQNIGNYLKPQTGRHSASFVEYAGDAYRIIFQNGRVQVAANETVSEYSFPKIMYVPAERNFVSTVDRPDLMKRLPLPLYTFLDEYEAAKQSLKGIVDLPVGDTKFEYRKQDKKSLLVGKNYKIDLLEASSGFQSLVPLILVSRHLAESIHRNGDSSHKAISVEEVNRIRKEIDSILNNDDNISEDVRRVLFEKLSAKFGYSSFINVVEEPEQNLYPTSQKNILFELLKYANDLDANRLVITTHSPIVINYLTLAIKAQLVKSKLEIHNAINSEDGRILQQLVPLESAVAPEKVRIYQIDKAGRISKLENYFGIPSDSNYLNEALGEINGMYDQLLEIEENYED